MGEHSGLVKGGPYCGMVSFVMHCSNDDQLIIPFAKYHEVTHTSNLQCPLDRIHFRGIRPSKPFSRGQSQCKYDMRIYMILFKFSTVSYTQGSYIVQYLNDMTSHKLQHKQTQLFASHQSVLYNISKVLSD